MKRLATGWFVAALIALLALTLASPGWAANLVVNGDFETDTALWTVWPGYVGGGGVNPANITGWTGEGGRGINPVVPNGPTDAPFRDNGNNTTSIAFLQGVSYIEQTVSGLTVGAPYLLGLDFNARNCCGDFPIGSVLVNGLTLSSTPVVPVGGSNPWHHAETDFVAPFDSLTLRIAAAPQAGGDATLIVDNVFVQLIPEPSSALLSLLGLLGLVSCRRRTK